METKTIKIPKAVHKELKVFVANTEGENMEDVAGYAIMDYLKSKGHKFSKPTSPTLSKEEILKYNAVWVGR